MLAACGRVGFDARSDASGDGRGDTMQPGSDAMPSDLIAWWKLDENGGTVVHDSIGTADGMFNGTPMWTTGELGSALQFQNNGNGANVGLGTPASLANLPALTVSAWVNLTSVAADGLPHCIFDRGDYGPPSGGWVIYVNADATGDVAFEAFFSSGPDNVYRASRPNALTSNRWQHVVVTWGGGAEGSTVGLYVDGADVTGGAIRSAIGARADDSTIGAAINCIASTSLAGAIDDIKVWARVLSPQEVAGI